MCWVVPCACIRKQGSFRIKSTQVFRQSRGNIMSMLRYDLSVQLRRMSSQVVFRAASSATLFSTRPTAPSKSGRSSPSAPRRGARCRPTVFAACYNWINLSSCFSSKKSPAKNLSPVAPRRESPPRGRGRRRPSRGRSAARRRRSRRPAGPTSGSRRGGDGVHWKKDCRKLLRDKRSTNCSSANKMVFI